MGGGESPGGSRRLPEASVLRPWMLSIPLLAALAAAAGAALAARALVAVSLAALLGLALSALLAVVAERRTREVAEQVERLARGDTSTRLEGRGGRQWRRLARSLAQVSASLERRFDELAGERERVQRLLDTLPSAVLVFTADGLAYANPRARELFAVDGGGGRCPAEVLGGEGLAGAVAEARETGRDIAVDVEHGDRHLRARASVTAAGEVALVVTDLTDLRRVEAVRRDFVTNASHELKTPVAGIQALSDSLGLALDRDPERARGMVQRLQFEAARLAQLVRDLLDLARLEEPAAAGSRQRVDVAEIVRMQAERIAGAAEERGVRVDWDCDGPATVVAVPQDIRLVAANLLENAVRYNRAGGSVHARVRRRAGAVEVEVVDTGVGIPERDLDRVFERFYRTDKGRSRAAGGTGLGLSLVRHAVERHGGQVRVRSVVGEGSTFTVTLPVEGRE